jgi:hypothetical protein
MKITWEYMPDAFLQACDVVRLIRAVGYPVSDDLRQFLKLACEETGWDYDALWHAVFNEIKPSILRNIGG